jgi:hypothetical protein
MWTFLTSESSVQVGRASLWHLHQKPILGAGERKGQLWNSELRRALDS